MLVTGGTGPEAPWQQVTELGPGIPAAALEAPRLRHPGGRDYVLFRGPLRAAPQMGHQVTSYWHLPQSPSLMWPADRSWCVATEVDFDSTLLAGPDRLVGAVLAERDLEVWPVRPGDDLACSADGVNGT